MEASPLAEVYDETVGQLLEVLAEKDRLQGRVIMLERQVQCKDEQLQLFARWGGPCRRLVVWEGQGGEQRRGLWEGGCTERHGVWLAVHGRCPAD